MTKLSNEEFARQFQALGAGEMAKLHQWNQRSVFRRRRSVEKTLGIELIPPGTRYKYASEARVKVAPKNGVVLVGSDAHVWPGDYTVAQRAFIEFCSRLKPYCVVMNGDVIDAACISRHPPIGWEDAPAVQEELEAAQSFLHEVEMAAGKVRKVWTLGNHDARFEMRLASVAAEFKGVQGIHLKDHFPNWEPGWSVELGEGINGVIIKHRFKGGMHAPHNNALWAGRTMVTGHLHSQKVIPITDYNGTRYGVDGGCLASARGPQFSYTEDNPLNWREGFCVLTWHKGTLLYPELVTVMDEDHVQFRGEVIRV